MPQRLLEICCDSAASAFAAQSAGADRIELCENLAQGGVTPSWGKVKLVKEGLQIPVCVLVRPRKADFLYSDDEFQIMLHDIAQLKDLGVDGIVSGVLLPDGQIDLERSRRLVAASAPLPFTFHRAFDMCLDPLTAIDQLVEIGVQRILSSGQHATALLGKANLRAFAERADERLSIMACGELLPDSFDEILELPGIWEYHAAVRRVIPSRMAYFGAVNMGDEPVAEEFSWMEVDPALVQGLKTALLNHSAR